MKVQPLQYNKWFETIKLKIKSAQLKAAIIDSQIKHEQDNPSIGLILCKHKDKVEAEYSLRDIQKPIGISEYKLTHALPKKFQTQLPTVEQLENQLNKS